MVKVETISTEEANKEFAAKRVKGQWAEIIGQVKETGEPRKISDLTRGQVAALYRSAKGSGLAVRTNYKDGYVVLALE